MPSRLQQLRQAIGTRQQVAGKLARIRESIRVRMLRGEFERRMGKLQDLGLVDTLPTRLQVRFAGMDMLRFCILPAAKAYYIQQGIDMRFHYFLRFLEDPMSMLDPTGLSSTKETLIGHLLQSVHLNPVYDLQLLCMFDDGLDELQRQAEHMVAGTHPRQASIAVTVEDPAYHEKLLTYIKAFRQDPGAEPPLRDVGDLRNDPQFLLAEKTFHTLPGFLRYATHLPTTLRDLMRHRRTTSLNPQFCNHVSPD